MLLLLLLVLQLLLSKPINWSLDKHTHQLLLPLFEAAAATAADVVCVSCC